MPKTMQDLTAADLEGLPTEVLYSLRYLLTSTVGHEVILAEREFATMLKSLKKSNKQIYNKLAPFYYQTISEYDQKTDNSTKVADR